MLVFKTGGANKQFLVNATLNETEFASDSTWIGSDIGTFFGGLDWGLSRSQHQSDSTTVNIGDRIGAKVWISSGGTGLELMDFAQWIYPSLMEVTSISIALNFAAPGSNRIIGDLRFTPAFGIKGALGFAQYFVNAGASWDSLGIAFLTDSLNINSVFVNQSRGAQNNNLRSIESPFTENWHKHIRTD